jgi:hypothetical protein
MPPSKESLNFWKIVASAFCIHQYIFSWSGKSVCNESSLSKACKQAVHHVAQKSMITSLPLKSDRVAMKDE